jgi:hypothetical protein
MRNRRVLHPDRISQLGHWARPLPQRSQDQQPTRGRQCLQRGRHMGGGFGVKLPSRPTAALNPMPHTPTAYCI